MIRLVWRTDVHLSDRPPASRKDDWVETVFGKLGQVRLLAEKLKAAAILDGGDFFHIKSPSRNSHDLVRRVADHHADYPCPVYCTPGNHDSIYGDYGFLEGQPLGVLFSTGVFRRLYDDYEAVFEVEGLKVRVVGVPYHGTKYDLDRFAKIKRGDEDHLVCVAHLLASEKGGTMFEGEDILQYEDLVQFAPTLWLFGHWHKDQGVQTIGSKTFVNIGSLTRGSLSQDNVDRKPACGVLSFTREEAKVQVARLRVQPAEEVFDMDTRLREEIRTTTVDAFVETVRAALVDKVAETTVEQVIAGMSGVPEKIKERTLLYWERA